jgi:hypothetical protein
MGLFDIRAIVLPYCLKLQACGRYALLNRAYKPLGFYTREYINYGDFPVLITMRMTPQKAAKISYAKDTNIREVFLYNDGCAPTSSPENWQAYTERLLSLSLIRILGAEQDIDSIKSRVIRTRNLRDAKITP